TRFKMSAPMEVKCFYFLILSFCCIFGIVAFESINKQTIDQLRSSSDFLVVYYGTANCEACLTSAKLLDAIRDNSLIQDLKIIKTEDAEAAKDLSITTFPQIVFFRKNNPIIYSEPLDDEDTTDDIIMWLSNNVEVATKVLDDDNFEHLTQASTGATTGDWLVMFYSEECSSLLPSFEGVSAIIKQRQNGAIVNIDKSPKLKKRFNIQRCPTIIFFRLGKQYTFNAKYDTSALTSFAGGWYKNMPSQKVLPLPSPFDELVENIAQDLKNVINGPNGSLVVMVTIAALIALMVVIAICFVCAPRQKDTKMD
ncbi:unnamed protein product, partial [Owenia fusiformis]